MGSFLKGILLSASLSTAVSSSNEADVTPLESCTYRLHQEDTFLIGQKKDDPADDTLLITDADITAIAVAKKGSTVYFLTSAKALAPMKETLIRRESETTGLASAIRGDRLPYTADTAPITYLSTDITLHKGERTFKAQKISTKDAYLGLVKVNNAKSASICPAFEAFNVTETLYSYGYQYGEPVLSKGLYQYSLEQHDQKKQGLHTIELPSASGTEGSVSFRSEDGTAVPIGILVDYVIVDGSAQKTFADAKKINAFLERNIP
jgi:hypothetical protein